MASSIPQDNSSNSLLSILNLFRPSGGSTTTTTPGTTSTQDSVSDAAVNAKISDILGGTSGLASLASGEKASGGYNTTTNTLLTNDLLSRAAGIAASLNKNTTTTTSGGTKTISANPQLSSGNAFTAGALGLGTSLASSLLGPTLKGMSKKLGLDTAGDRLASSILGSGNNSTLPSGILGSEGGVGAGSAFTASPDNLSDTLPLGLAGQDNGTTSFLADSGFSPSFTAANNFEGDVAGSVSGAAAGDTSSGVVSDAALNSTTDAASASVDTSMAADTGIGAAVTTDDAAAPVIDNATSYSDWFGGLFANGGQVPKKPGSSLPVGIAANMPASMQTTDTGNRYANGGEVTSGARTVGALSNTDATRMVEDPSLATTPVTSNNPNNSNVTNNSSLDSNANTNANTPTVANNENSMANPAGIMASMAQLGLATTPIGALMAMASVVTESMYGKSPINALASAFGIGTPNISTTAMDNQQTSIQSSLDAAQAADNASPGTSIGSTSSDISGAVGIGSSDTTDDGIGTGMGSSSDTGNSSDTSSDSSSSSGDGSSGSSDGGSSDGGNGGDGGGDSSSGDKNGGKIPGHDTQGKDNINIHVSGGEYVIPTDVVDKLGVNFFKQLSDALHTPIK